jgi:dihydrodipicolinate synthase/N-acetylneuraminate lyase
MSITLGVQAGDTAGMLEYARVAESLEPDGMIAIPRTSADSLAQIRAYYAALCEITSRPIFVQTNGGRRLSFQSTLSFNLPVTFHSVVV